MSYFTKLNMITFLLIILFSLAACLESIAYGIYEIQINQNKARWY